MATACLGFRGAAQAFLPRAAGRARGARGARGTVRYAAAKPQVTLFTKPGCTLCDKAMEKLKQSSQPFELSTINIEAPGNEEWNARYWCDIPVFHINGAFWAKHRLTEQEVEAALSEAAEGSFQRRDGEPAAEAECGDGCECDDCQGH
ncbi:unnamed protein product [Effrenium voratum]|nr:unnamed protein product [Effrenium voratum]